MPKIKIFLDKGKNNNCPSRVLAQTAKTWGGTVENLDFWETARKGLPKSKQRIAESLLGVEQACEGFWQLSLPTRLFRSYGHFVMAYAYGYSESYSTADRDCSESQKGPRDFFSVFSVSVVETLENESRFDINFTYKGQSRDRYILFYTINSIHIYSKSQTEKKNRKGKDTGRKIIREKNSPWVTRTNGFRNL